MINFDSWSLRAVALTLALSGFFFTPFAHALTLGPITVQSALGEPLRAEVEVLSITADEATNLRVNVASLDNFKATGLQFNPALTGVQIALQRRPNGRSFLILSGSRRVTEPFVDLVLELTWSSGRLLRDFTLLFDPPNLRRAHSKLSAPSSSTAPVTAPTLSAPAPAAATVAPAASVPTPAPAPAAAPTAAPLPTPAAPVVTPKPAEVSKKGPSEVPSLAKPPAAASSPAAPTPVPTASAPATPAPAASAPTNPSKTPAEPKTQRPESSAKTQLKATRQVVVKPGETAGEIATENKPANVSLDQMLVALLKNNPDAFVSSNVNRLKAGAVLDMPTDTEVSAVDAEAATHTIVAQSKSFNDFRRKLAENALNAQAQVTQADRQASGKVQAQVQDTAAAPITIDKLTLSKGATPTTKPGVNATTAEEKIARERQAQDSAARMAELSQNISTLKKIGATTSSAASAGSTDSKPTLATGLPVPAPRAVPSAPAAASIAASAPPAVASSAPVAPLTKQKSTPTVLASFSGQGVISTLADNAAVLLVTTGLLVLLAGFGFYQTRQHKAPPQMDSSFLESRLQPDSFFGGSGGHQIDTHEAPSHHAVPVYSPSQLDTAGDVDPIAEADVYLAYGRDLQAEEILKEALKVDPTKAAIYVKLAEIYVKRRDTVSFEALAQEAFDQTQANGPEWARICKLGHELDTTNPLFQPGSPFLATQTAENTAPAPLSSAIQQPGVDIDLNTQFAQHDRPTQAPTPAPVPTSNAAQAAPSEPDDARMLAFDLNSLSLDLESPAMTGSQAAGAPVEPQVPIDPLQTKLSLAEEFVAIGDIDGARSLVEEVLGQATGALKQKAQKLLGTLA